MKVKIAQYIADFLADKGVSHVFTVTGGGAMHLNDAFGHHERLKCIYNHHEQASAIAAEGYTRMSGVLSAVCVTSGPGGTNAMTGVLGAWLDSIPMFVVSGQVKRETTIHSTSLHLRQLGDQEYDIVSSVKSMTKYAAIVMEPRDIAMHLEKAYFLAINGRPGPVWLDIPLDVQAAWIETDELLHYNQREDANREIVKYNKLFTAPILQKLTNSKHPVLLLGTGVRLAQYRDEVIKFAERIRIPVVTAWNAHDLVSDNFELFCGRPGTVGTRGGNFVVQNADLIIVLGCRLNIRQISYNYEKWAPKAYKIVVDIDQAELYKPTINVDMPIWADLRDVIDDLNKRAVYYSPKHEEWLAWCKNVCAKYPVVQPDYYDDKKPLNPYVFIKEFMAKLDDDEQIVCGNGSACVIGFQAAVIKEKTRLFTNSGCAAMGYGFPAAIGACVARAGKRVICIDGDGSFQMNLQELQTMIYNNLNLKIIYLNNNGYHSIRQTQMNLFKGKPLVGVCEGTGISFPDAERLANAYNIPFIRVNSIKDIPTLIGLIKQDGPLFAEIVLDETQCFAPKLSSKVLPDGTIVSPEIDDMFPFLERKEYEGNKLN
ncbi:MAG: thiamine pyrophosphate-binding protein [Victivallales bacterium]|nr:thiamine pyrophosphate-binding protein [Victivallales bacterium]